MEKAGHLEEDSYCHTGSLGNFPNTCLVSKLQTDVSVRKETTLRGLAGVLAKLRGYFVADYPMVNCRQDFTRCTQDQGEKFNECWEKKLAKAVE